MGKKGNSPQTESAPIDKYRKTIGKNYQNWIEVQMKLKNCSFARSKADENVFHIFIHICPLQIETQSDAHSYRMEHHGPKLAYWPLPYPRHVMLLKRVLCTFGFERWHSYGRSTNLKTYYGPRDVAKNSRKNKLNRWENWVVNVRFIQLRSLGG